MRLPSDPQPGPALSNSLRRPGLNLALTFRPDELHRVPTDDGSTIALGRYHPRGRRRFQEPVILCHGLGANRFHLDFDTRYSLARYLAQRGYEAWVLELRGRGLAGPATACTFDDQAQYDVRAALRTVLASGAHQVAWVGHSKGGLALFAHVARNPDAPLKAVVALGSPATFRHQPGLKIFIRRIAPLLKLDSLPLSRLNPIAVLGTPPGPVSRYLALESNMEPGMARRAFFNLTSSVPGGVARQFAQWIRTGRFDSLDGQFDYRANMGALRVPLLLVAGNRDLLAPPLAVRAARDAVGGPVTFTVLGKSQGFLGDYGHGDMVLGRHSPDEVFPLVEQFLAHKLTPHA